MNYTLDVNGILPKVRDLVTKQKKFKELQCSKSNKQQELINIFEILVHIDGLFSVLDCTVIPKNVFLELQSLKLSHEKLKVHLIADIDILGKQIDSLELEISALEEDLKSVSDFVTDGGFLQPQDIQSEYLEEYLYLLMCNKISFAEFFTDEKAFINLLYKKLDADNVNSIVEIITAKRGNLPLFLKFFK